MRKTVIVETLEVRRQLKRTWGPFLSRFGKLQPIQREAIPVILEGKNVVLVSATASGKTEAVAAPIVEQVLSRGVSGLQVLYVSPTRALVNDLQTRLCDPISEVGLSLAVKTGERPQFKPTAPQQILITTPESFDSLLDRYPKVFETLRWVVLDELHLLDGTYRGDQLRILLDRLRLFKGSAPIQFCALSATLVKPADVAARYFTEPQPIVVSGTREIQYELLPLGDLSILHRKFVERRIAKALFFCNTRKQTESFAQRLSELFPPERIYVHHASLARRERHEVEKAMREQRWAYCVATMTLELGIDIGDIEIVGLVRPPQSVASLLQRIGRGNRRDNLTVGIGLYKTDLERDAFEYLFELAKTGELEDRVYRPHLSVTVQQIFSHLFQRRFHGAALNDLMLLLKPVCPEGDDLHLIIKHLEDWAFLEVVRGKIYPTQKLLDMAETGRIHSNIEDELEYLVIDVTTDRQIGQISMLPAGKYLLLAGRGWQIKSIQRNRVYVSPTRRKDVKTLFWPKEHSLGAFFSYLPESLQEKEREKWSDLIKATGK